MDMSEPMQTVGRYLAAVGAVMVVVGLVLLVAPKVPFLGKLPGDIHIRKDEWDVYIPLTTSVLLSLVLTLAVWIYQYLTKK